jgi:hypothetical protein
MAESNERRIQSDNDPLDNSRGNHDSRIVASSGLQSAIEVQSTQSPLQEGMTIVDNQGVPLRALRKPVDCVESAKRGLKLLNAGKVTEGDGLEVLPIIAPSLIIICFLVVHGLSLVGLADSHAAYDLKSMVLGQQELVELLCHMYGRVSRMFCV